MQKNNSIASPVVSYLSTVSKAPKPYFGKEAFGDLNGDERNDVAFVIKRKDEDQKLPVYYLAASIFTTSGNVGTNLIFMGNDLEPENLSIENGVITVNSIDRVASTTVKTYARIVDGELKRVKSLADADSANKVSGVSTSTATTSR